VDFAPGVSVGGVDQLTSSCDGFGILAMVDVVDKPGSALVNDAEVPGVVWREGEVRVWGFGDGDGEKGVEGEFEVVGGVLLGKYCGGGRGTDGKESCDASLDQNCVGQRRKMLSGYSRLLSPFAVQTCLTSPTTLYAASLCLSLCISTSNPGATNLNSPLSSSS